jgi:hypothetical protein
MNRMLKAVLAATAAAGTLDIVYAAIMASLRGNGPLAMLRTVASGPFGNGMRDAGLAGALTGLAVHFAIMSAMALAFVLTARRLPILLRAPFAAGLAYGLLLYAVMYWLVLPLRWPTAHPSLDPATIGSALFAHVVLVGLPIAYIAALMLRPAQQA